MRWLFLILASVCEICWFYCISYLNQVTVGELLDFSFINRKDASLISLSVVGYAGFGIANIFLFAKALQKIPAAIAFSVWSGLALAGITLFDGLFMNIQLNFYQIGSIGLIIVGVIGLKFYGNTQS
jgi:quaternary ammonium compound-resistance protein SugE